jgi:hypothetical protein
MRGWLARGLAALRIGADRSDLWPAGALAWLVFGGWVPLALVVAPPDAEGIEAFAISMYLSQAFPLNVIALGVAVVAVFAALCALSAAAEVAILQLATPRGRRPSSARATLDAFAIVLLGSVPVVAALGLVLVAAINVAPAEYLSSELSTPILLRIALRLVPQLLVVLLVLIAMQALAGVALRTSYANPTRPATVAFADAFRAIRARPLVPLGVATVGLLMDALLVALNVAILGVLWPPIGTGLGDGLPSHPETILLLLGFVAIWLGLLLAAGALHTAVSAWWAMEVRTGARLSASGPAGQRAAGSETGGPQ